MTSDQLQQIRNAYPKRQGSQGWYGKPFQQIINARLSEGHTFDDMLNGAEAYKKHCDHTQITNTCFVMQAKRFFGPSLYFLETYEVPEETRVYRKPEEYTEEQRKADQAKAWKELNRLRGVT